MLMGSQPIHPISDAAIKSIQTHSKSNLAFMAEVELNRSPTSADPFIHSTRPTDSFFQTAPGSQNSYSVINPNSQFQCLKTSKSSLMQKLKISVMVFFLLCIIASGGILFMCLVGIIKFETVEEKNLWIEVNSQILNAIFTLNALIVHPWRLVFSYQFWRRSPSDLAALKKVFKFFNAIDNDEKKLHPGKLNEIEAQNKPQIPNSTETITEGNETNTDPKFQLEHPELDAFDRLLIVLVLLNINCFTQYPIASVMWAWAADVANRPSYIVYTFLPFSFLSGCFAGLLEYKWNKQLKI